MLNRSSGGWFRTVDIFGTLSCETKFSVGPRRNLHLESEQSRTCLSREPSFLYSSFLLQELGVFRRGLVAASSFLASAMDPVVLSEADFVLFRGLCQSDPIKKSLECFCLSTRLDGL